MLQRQLVCVSVAALVLTAFRLTLSVLFPQAVKDTQVRARGCAILLSRLGPSRGAVRSCVSICFFFLYRRSPCQWQLKAATALEGWIGGNALMKEVQLPMFDSFFLNSWPVLFLCLQSKAASAAVAECQRVKGVADVVPPQAADIHLITGLSKMFLRVSSVASVFCDTVWKVCYRPNDLAANVLACASGEQCCFSSMRERQRRHEGSRTQSGALSSCPQAVAWGPLLSHSQS